MQDMTAEERREFLLGSPRTAKLATVRANGRPHVAPVWFDLDGDDFLFTTWHTTVKAANLRRDPHVSLCIDEEQPPFAFVIVDGTAEFIDDPGQLAGWGRRIAGRYMGAELAEAYGQRNAVPGELLVRVRPYKILAKSRISDW